MRKNLLQKIFSWISIASLLVQVLMPLTQVTQAYAQEATPTDTVAPTPTDTVAPTDTSTPTPADTITPTVTPDDTVTPTSTPTDSITPTDTSTPAPVDTLAPSDNPTDTVAPTTNVNDNTSSQGPPDTLSPAPTGTPDNTKETGSLTATVLSGVSTDTVTAIDFSSLQTSNATLTTDKPDYSPTGTAIISGSNFTPTHTFSLTISSTDSPATSTTVNVTTDNNGNFVYAYQLDGTYRPNYSVVITDAGTIIATTSFTDSNASANLDQCRNGAPGSPVPCSGSAWVNGNAGASNSHYREGDSIPYRFSFTNLSLGTHTITFQWDTTKAGKHAIDYITTYNRTEATSDPCSDIIPCTPSSPTSTFPIPVDANVSGAGILHPQIAGVLTMFNGTITSVGSSPYYTLTGTYSGDSSESITVTFTASNPTVVLTWGGHIGSQNDWGTGMSAVNISGSPYHTRLISFDGGGGNQDRSLEAAGVLPTPTLTTQVSNANITIGSSVTDTATLTGSNGTVTGSIAFFACGPTGSVTPCITGGAAEGNVTLSSGHATSSSFTPGATGTYCFRAEYSPDASAQYSPINATITTNECVTVTNPPTGTLTVTKVTNPNDTTTLFGITATGSGTITGNATQNIKTGSPVTYTVTAGTYSVSEAALAGWSQTGNTCSNVTVTAGGSASCTITNTKLPTLKVIKTVVNNNGGTATASAFTVHVKSGSSDVSGSPATGSSTGTTYTLATGTYTVSENDPTAQGYAQTGIVCDSGKTNPVVLNAGDNVTCTITNDDNAPSLTLTKVVSNTHGGTATAGQWTLTATGTGDSPTNLSGTTPVTSGGTFKADTYTLAESTGPSGYTASNWSCTNNVTVTNSQITLGVGQTTTCTITNSDVAPTLKLVKQVTNNNGGTNVAHDWTLTATGTNGFSDTGDSTTFHAVNGGVSYVLSESTIPGYAAGSWSCNGGNQSTNHITLGVGQNVTCTITNDDIAPSLTLVKQVVGGSDAATAWTLTATGTGGSPTNLSGTTPVTSGGTFKADTYTLAESNGPTGYTASAWSCNNGITVTNSTITFGLNQSTTCTITNTRDQGTIELKKVWSGVAGQTTLNIGSTANGSDVASQLTGANGTAPLTTGAKTVNTNTYYVSETGGLSNYASVLTCTDNATPVVQGANNSVVVSKGHTVICTFTNTRNTGSLNIHKQDQAGNPMQGVQFSIAGVSTASASTNVNGDVSFSNIPTGSYTVTETVPSNYHWTSTSGDCTNANPAGVTVATNTTASCTFVNTRDTGSIKVHKLIDTNGDGVFETTDAGANVLGFSWSLDGSGTNTMGSTVSGVVTGQHSVSESSVTGYHFVGWYATGNIDHNCANPQGTTLPIALSVAYNFTTDITLCNAHDTGTITVNKVLSPTNDSGKFDLQVDGVTKASNVGNNGTTGQVTVITGTHTVAELGNNTDLSTYHGVISGDCDSNGSVSVATGQNKVCTITNTKLGTIIVKKTMVGGTGSFTFTGDVAGTISTNNGTLTTNNVLPGTYSSVEGATTGWDLTNISCDDSRSQSVSSGDIKTATANFKIDPGETVTCTFTNTKKGHLIVHKAVNTVQDQNDTLFGILATGSGTITGDGTGNVSVNTPVNYEVTPGTYSVHETVPTGWDLTTNGCLSQPVAAGVTVDCTITNTQHGSIHILKYEDLNANGAKESSAEAALSGWDITVSTLGTKTTDNTGYVDYTDVVPGPYTVSETLQNGWFQSNIACSNDAPGIDNSNNHPTTVSPGQAVFCEIGNFQNAHVIVTKDVLDPDGKPVVDTSTSFGFTLGNQTTSLTDGQSHDFTTAPGAAFAVTETPDQNYTFGKCTASDDPNQSALSTENGYSSTLQSGQTIHVTCTNLQKKATITVHKVVELSDGTVTDDTHSFTAELNGGSDESFSQNNPTSYSVNPGGPYTITELSDPNYTNLGCRISADISANGFSVASNQTVTVTCTNKQNPGSILGSKTDATSGQGIPNWVIDLFTCNAGFVTCVLSTTTPTDSHGNYSFGNLVTGFYQVAEELQAGWTAVGNLFYNITITPGHVDSGNAFVNFKNFSVTVCKKQDADGNLGTSNDQSNVLGWEVHLITDGNTDTPVVAKTGDNGCYTFSDLGPHHTYAVTEVVPSDWTALTDTSFPVTVASGDNQTFTFINFHNASISGQKYDDLNGNGAKDAGENGLQGWTIQLENTNGDVLKTTTTAADGSYSFDNLGPGTYRVREVAQAGWVQKSTNPDDISLISGQDVQNVDFGNQGQGTIIVTKFLDDNANGTMDASESALPGWEMNLDESSQTTGVDGTTTFTNVPAGTHSLGETQQDGWNLSNIYCSNDQRIIIDSVEFNFVTLSQITHEVTVNPGDTINCYVGNYQKAHITVVKEVIDPDGNPIVAGSDTTKFTFSTTGQQGYTLADGDSTSFDVTPGSYDVTETGNPNYTLVSCKGIYNGEEAIGIFNLPTATETVSLGSNDSVVVTCINQQQKGHVHGYKWSDLNGNGQFDCTFNEDQEFPTCEPKLAGWTIFADTNNNGVLDNGEVSTTTDQNGNYTLDLNPGTYNICEVAQLGWKQTYPANETNCHTVTISSNQTFDGNANFGNQKQIPVLTITKTNDKLGIDQAPGDSVLYTLTITATQSAAENVVLTDLLPKGFKYRDGSATIDTGDGSGPQTFTNFADDYHSPGIWDLGNMQKDQTFTLQLIADIDGSQNPGLYKDVAFAEGQSLAGDAVSANSQSNGNPDPEINGVVDSNFVGTQVNVVKQQVNGATFGVSQTTTTQQVLGAATSALPETGANTLWMIYAMLILTLGAASISIGYILRKRYV